jgi:hypothetical protein
MQPPIPAVQDPVLRHADVIQQGTLPFLRLIEEACRQSAVLLARCQIEHEPRHDPRGRTWDPMPPA